ncbi:SurA N-terminal domain-containing protein [Pseudomonas sp. N040]|uniref:SurA N-terminal domain-containing protein n=1 Tax=Pseudomonas sp. N040 TaxID=2785325 RepID=UPI0018A2B32E|nr:SurA N-terminal domain-containing protein [Pseudomonas sp. N040]MBF7730693.1 SurA N-terminal domain-containing protein [Pseudomonas sp. N040]MBW7014336.1 SurA N-terminal domain-containing protein [Pseudomonas sp. N040]
MLQNIRDNSQGWIAKTIIGLMVVLMALFGVDQIFQSVSNSQDAAEVNGEAISLNALAQAADMQRRQLQQQLGNQFDESMINEKLLRDSALNGLIERQLLLQGAADSGFALSEVALDQVILQEPAFQVDGKFNADRFDMVIRQAGYTRQQIRDRLRADMLVMQLQAGVAGSSFVTDAEIAEFARLEKQTRDFAILTVKASTEGITVSDADINTFYDQHAAEFLSPEQVQLEYVELKKADFFDQVEVSAEELQSQYQKEIAGLAEQRQAAHILIEVDDKVTDEQARQKLVDIQQRLTNGADFSALAKEFSADPGSANSGGDLGYAGPGVYDPAFEEALYALKPGEVSAPVRSAYGWHLIKLLGVQAADIPSFDSLKEKLTKDLKAEKVEQRFVEVSKELEDSAFESADLTQPAQELGLDIKLSELFGREGGPGLAANRQVLLAAFSEELLENAANSQLIELDADTVVVVRVKVHNKPEQLPVESVASVIRDQLLTQRAAAAAVQKGEQLLAALREGKTLADSSATDQTWAVVEAASRNQENVAPEVLQAVFRMPKPGAEDKPSFSGIATRNGDFTLIRLNGVNEPQATAFSDEDRATYRRFLSSRSGQQDFAAYRRQLQEHAEIERF